MHSLIKKIFSVQKAQCTVNDYNLYCWYHCEFFVKNEEFGCSSAMETQVTVLANRSLRLSLEEARGWEVSLGGAWGALLGAFCSGKVGGSHTVEEGRLSPLVCNLTKKRLEGLSKALYRWWLGIANHVYPLSCWEQVSLSVGLLSLVKQAHTFHWHWWDYALLSGGEQWVPLGGGCLNMASELIIRGTQGDLFQENHWGPSVCSLSACW